MSDAQNSSPQGDSQQTPSSTPSTAQDLAGRGAIITGSSRGIGAETAKLLAARGAGVVVGTVAISAPLDRLRVERKRVESQLRAQAGQASRIVRQARS